MTPPTVRALTPMAHVADVPRSIRFYEHLGFRVGNTFQPAGASAPAWAWLTANGAELMVTASADPIDRRQQGVLFYLYCDDVRGMHDHLRAAGVEVGNIGTEFYAPAGEFRVTDPDGYVIMITHT